ncbi:hypothetical protein EDC04DRAFT_2605749 [Pisolithus marmoratus]|nr:hypothetical protein EDC04DRAFT_2605749 [Pisolithus marmoratus]
MYNGDIHTLCSKDSVVLSMKSMGRMMGGAAIDLSHTFFIIDNAANGFSLHHMDDAVALTEEAIVVVGGGENGCIHVFDRTTGQAVQALQHSNSGRVQTVATHDAGNFHLILMATSSNKMETLILVWRKEAHIQAKPETRGESGLLFMLVTVVVVVLLAIQMMQGNISVLTKLHGEV